MAKGPLAVTVGIAGCANAFTTTGADVPLQLPLPVVTVKVPEVEVVIDCVVAPFDHRYEDALPDESITLPPVQNDVEPEVEITGIVPVLEFETVTEEEVTIAPLELVTFTEKVPALLTVIDCVVCPPGIHK